MGKNILWLLMCFLLSCLNLQAQEESFEEYKKQLRKEFEEYKVQNRTEFERYRTQLNEEHAKYMENLWTEHKTAPAIPVPPSPEPPSPVVADPNQQPTTDPMPFEKVKPAPKVTPQPEPLLPPEPKNEPAPPKPAPQPAPTPQPQPKPQPQPQPQPTPKPEPVVPSVPQVSFNYYGVACSVPFDNSLKISLSNNDEKSVANAWKKLSADESVATVRSAIDYRNRLGLSDWGYVRFVEKFADAVYPSRRDEANLLKVFMLTQSGYKVRMGRNSGRIVMLLPSNDVIYNYSYIPMEGTNYYIMDKNIGGGSTALFDRQFPKEQKFSLVMNQQPALPMKAAPSRRLTSSFDKGISVDVTVNRNLIDFYNDYPISGYWDLYAAASLSDDVKKQLYPELKNAISGRSERDAANILLHFVQKAFDYATDDEQFGEERPLFADESIFYPYNDCEDRAIFYSILVKDLLGLESVLLYYPGHLATAVNFKSDVAGDYFNVDGKKYVVCDPTYINSNVGMSMPTCKNQSAEVIKTR